VEINNVQVLRVGKSTRRKGRQHAGLGSGGIRKHLSLQEKIDISVGVRWSAKYIWRTSCALEGRTMRLLLYLVTLDGKHLLHINLSVVGQYEWHSPGSLGTELFLASTKISRSPEMGVLTIGRYNAVNVIESNGEGRERSGEESVSEQSPRDRQL